MKKYIITLCLNSVLLFPWSGKESSDSKNINFYGTIETYEGQSWDVQNIAFGKDRESARVKKIVMYDAPKEYDRDSEGRCILKQSPSDMTYSEIDLNEIDSIEALNSSNRWLFKEHKKKYGIEYKEVIITHKDGKRSKYLIELGREDSLHKTKVFCSVRHIQSSKDTINENKSEKIQSKESTKKYSVCAGIAIDELEEKGIPIQALKKITIEGFCHQVLVQ